MGSPLIFNGKFSKSLTSRGIIRSDGGINEYDGPRNYIANSHFEQGVTGWSLLTTTLTSGIPTGSLTLSATSLSALAVTSTNPLAGSQSLQITAGTAWTAGQGIVSTAFTVDRKDLGKVLTFKFYYEAVTGPSLINWSGVLGSQSFGVYIYDTTASAWVQPAGFLGMNQSTGQGYVTGTFQTSSTAGQQYQIALIALQAPSAGAIALNIDEIYLGPQTAPIGSVITDWKTFTATLTGSTSNPAFGTTTVNNAQWRRVGDSMEIVWQLKQTVAGSAGSGTYQFAIPTGYNIDTSKFITTTGATISRVVGDAMIYDGTNVFIAQPAVIDTSTTLLNLLVQTTINNDAIWGSAQTPLTNATLQVTMNAKLPILGWSSNVQMSNDTDTRVIAARASGATTSIPNATIVTTAVNPTLSFDTAGSYSTSTGKYTVPVAGYYRFGGACKFAGASNPINTSYLLYSYKNTIQQTLLDVVTLTAASTTGFSVAGFDTLQCVAGDVLEIRPQQTQGGAVALDGTNGNYVTFERVSGPAVVAVSESVNLRYHGTGAGTVTNNVATAMNINTKDWDSHGAWNGTTTFTAPISGKYLFSIQGEFGAFSAASAFSLYITANKNGSAWSAYHNTYPSGTSDVWTGRATDTVNLNAGDTLAFQITQNCGATQTIGNGPDTYVTIMRIGN